MYLARYRRERFWATVISLGILAIFTMIPIVLVFFDYVNFDNSLPMAFFDAKLQLSPKFYFLLKELTFFSTQTTPLHL